MPNWRQLPHYSSLDEATETGKAGYQFRCRDRGLSHVLFLYQFWESETFSNLELQELGSWVDRATWSGWGKPKRAS